MFKMKQIYKVAPREVSKNKLMYSNGIHFIYGKPASGKTTIAINTILSMKKKFIFIDYDSKDMQNINDIFTDLSVDDNNSYCPYLIYKYAKDKDGNTNKDKSRYDMFKEILTEAPVDSAILVDTWHYLVKDENDNNESKKILDLLLEKTQLKNLLVVFIGHVAKQTATIRGASSLLSNASCGLLVEKNDDRVGITVHKDSHGQIESCGAKIASYGKSIANTTIIYDNEKVEEEMDREQMKALLFIQKVVTILHFDIDKEISATEFKNHVIQAINKMPTGSGKKLPKQGAFDYFNTVYVNRNIADTVKDYLDVEYKHGSKFIQPIKDIKAWQENHDINLGLEDE